MYRAILPTRRPANWRSAALIAGAGLAASFLYVQAKKQAAERAHPPAGKFVEVDGVRLHYLERGSGADLVLLHGSGLCADDFALSGLLDKAAARYRVIAFDRPGYGYSERPGGTGWTPEAQARLIYQALHVLRVERPIVVGHSQGAQVALAMALDYPRYVRAIALLAGYYYPGAGFDAPLAALPATPVLGRLLSYTVAPLAARLAWPRLVRRMFAPAPAPERFERLPEWMALRPSQLRAGATDSGQMVAAARRLSQRYAELTMPITLIAGSGDAMVDVDAQARRLHGAISHSELIVREGAGHMLHYTDPDAVLAAIDALGTAQA